VTTAPGVSPPIDGMLLGLLPPLIGALRRNRSRGFARI
jgi:hypothetical protein